LNDSPFEYEGLKFWGSPISPTFFDWSFNRDRGPKIKRHWDMIPNDTDILITHGPPAGILDRNRKNVNCGCDDLLEALARVNPKLHVFGHIHESYGIHDSSSTKFVNASKGYNPVKNLPIVVDI